MSWNLILLYKHMKVSFQYYGNQSVRENKISINKDYILILLPNNTGHSRKYNLALYFSLARGTLDENISLS